MTVAVAGALAIQEVTEAGIVVFLFSLADWLESACTSSARRAIEEVLALKPETAILAHSGSFFTLTNVKGSALSRHQTIKKNLAFFVRSQVTLHSIFYVFALQCFFGLSHYYIDSASDNTARQMIGSISCPAQSAKLKPKITLQAVQ